jgi:hypothetical protein
MMTSPKKYLRSTIVAFGIGLVMPAAIPVGSLGVAQSVRYEDARQVVGRTQTDLERAATFLANNKERDRLRNAQKSLSTLDRHLAKGKFDKDTLDSAISDIQHVLDNDVLHGQDRDTLLKDIEDLRGVRADRG